MEKQTEFRKDNTSVNGSGAGVTCTMTQSTVLTDHTAHVWPYHLMHLNFSKLRKKNDWWSRTQWNYRTVFWAAEWFFCEMWNVKKKKRSFRCLIVIGCSVSSTTCVNMNRCTVPYLCQSFKIFLFRIFLMLNSVLMGCWYPYIGMELLFLACMPTLSIMYQNTASPNCTAQ